MTTEQELQSLLLRLSVLLASSLSTLTDSLPPTIIDPSSSSTYSAESLSAQILNDVNLLLGSVQKCCTNLTLALKPAKSSSKSSSTKQSGSFTPTDGLDSPSLDAAKAQLSDLTKDYIPKLTWLSRKASSEAVVYQYISKTEEDLKREKEERKLVMSQGGHIVQQSYSRETEKLEKIKGKGLGITWSKAIIAVMFELQEALGELSETFMSERTLSVLQKASEVRAKANAQRHTPSAFDRKAPKSIEEARQRALQATSKVWNVCDSALKGKLPKDNRIAVRQSWKSRTEILEDALKEFDEFFEETSVKGDSGFSEGYEEEIDADEPLETLTCEEKAEIALNKAPLRAACRLHSKVGELCLGRQSELEKAVDLDELDEAGDTLSGAIDELISALLYGDREGGKDKPTEGEEEARESFHKATKRLHLAATPLDTAGSLNAIASQCEDLG